MAEVIDENVIRYHRRLDRSPEKYFEKLPDSEKKLMSAMRGALENCRNKVVGMKDELEEKERLIEAERFHRMEAEERLKQYLVDPYMSPAVNSELRNRLPRANKSNPVLDQKDSELTEESEINEPSTTKNRSSKSKSKSFSPKRRSFKKRTVRKFLDFHAPSKANTTRANPNFMNGNDEMDDSSSEEENYYPREFRRNQSRRKEKHSSGHPTAPSFIYPHYIPGDLGYPVGQNIYPFLKGYNPHIPWNSLQPVRVGEHQPAPIQPRMTQSLSCPELNSEKAREPSPNMSTGVTINAETSEQVLPEGADQILAENSQTDSRPVQKAAASGDDKNQLPFSTSRSPFSQKSAVPSELLSHSASSMSSHYGLPTVLAGGDRMDESRGFWPQSGLPPAFSPSSLAAGATTPYANLSTHTFSMLHDEIGRLKESNRQLTETLSSKKHEVELLKLQIEAKTPTGATLDTDSARKFAELMMEVKAAEKRREEIMEARVRQAEEDRERMLHDLESTSSSTARELRRGRRLTLSDLTSTSESENSQDEEEGEKHQTFEEQETGHPVPTVSVDADTGRVAPLKDALKELERRNQKELQIYREELQVVMEQRDQALEQLQEVRERDQIQQLRMPSQREQILMAKISMLQREKDKADNLLRQLKAEQLERHLIIGLHKALFPDGSLNKNDTDTKSVDGRLASKLVNDKVGVSANLKEDNQLLEKLRQAHLEKSLLEKRCEELETSCKREKEEKNKLERLNGVLQKKLMAISTGSVQLQEE